MYADETLIFSKDETEQNAGIILAETWTPSL